MCARVCVVVNDTFVYVFLSRSICWICLSVECVEKVAALRGCFACILVSASVCVCVRVCVCVCMGEGGFV